MNELEMAKRLVSLMKGEGFKKEASAEEVAAQNKKDNAYYLNLLQSGQFGQRKAAVDFSEPLKIKVAYQAITTKIFDADNIANNVAWADVEFPEVGAAFVPFKGAPARVERGPKRIYYKTKTAAINWVIFYDWVFTAAYNCLDQAKDKVGIGLALLLDKELFSVLGAAGNSGFYQPYTTPTMSLGVINDIRGQMMQFDLVTAAIIMNPTRYYELMNLDSKMVDPVTLNTVIETGYVAQLYGVKFYMSKLCPVNVAYAITDKQYLGKYVLRQDQQIKIADISWKNRYIVTGYSNYGLCLHNMAAVRKIDFVA